ncbi:response regulator transcription factor [Spirillospora sp. CA-255316]
MTHVFSPVALVADVASICADPAPTAERAQGVLERIGTSIPCEAAALARYDPIEQRHFTLAEVNYTDQVLTYLNDGFISGDPAWQTMRYRNPTPLRWCDVPGYRQMHSAQEVFMPAGFREGITTCMFTRSGRYTGAFHLNSDSPLPVSDKGIEVLAALQRVVGMMLDGLQPEPAVDWTQLVAEADAAALLTADGRLSSVPGGTRTDLLGDRSALTSELTALGADALPSRYFWTGPDGRCYEVRLTRLARATVVTVRRQAPPHRLSPREIEVLTLLVKGLANPEIGQALWLSPRTVATHVEHILAKLKCTTRVVAASQAVAEGIVRTSLGSPSARRP